MENLENIPIAGQPGPQDTSLINQSSPEIQFESEKTVSGQAEEEQALETNEDIYAVKVDLSEERRERFVKVFRDEMSIIAAERGALRLEEKWKKYIDDYEGFKEDTDFPWPGAANYKIRYMTMAVDIGFEAANRHIFTPTPIFTLDAREKELTREQKEYDLRDREDHLDFLFRSQEKVAGERLGYHLNRYAYIQGTSAAKVTFRKIKEKIKIPENYFCSDDEIKIFFSVESELTGDLKRFADNYPDYQDPQSKDGRLFVELLSKRFVSVVREKEIIRHHGVSAYRIPIENLYVRPSIPEIKDQIVVAEFIERTCAEIERDAQSGFLIPDAVAKLKNNLGKNWDTGTVGIYETRMNFDLDEDGNYMRYICVFEESTQEILRSVYYPVENGVMDIIKFCIMPRDDNFYGYGFGERLESNGEMLNNAFNAIYNGFTLSQLPIIETTDRDLRFEARDWTPLSIMRHAKDTVVAPLRINGFYQDALNVASISQRLSEYSVGIPTLMTGQESSNDPTAPAAKTAMMLDQAQLRVASYTKKLLDGYADFAEAIEQIESQFHPQFFQWFSGSKRVLSHDIMSVKMRYVPAALSYSIDRLTELRLIMTTIETIAKVFPEVLSDQNNKHLLLDAVLSNTGGAMEKIKDDINPSPEEHLRKPLVEGTKEYIKKLRNKIKEERQSAQPVQQEQGGDV